MSTAYIVLVVACLVSPHARMPLASYSAQEPSTSDSKWRIGLRAFRHDSIETGCLFGNPRGWLSTADELPLTSFDVKVGISGLEVAISRTTEYGSDELRLWITPETAMASARSGSCTWLWPDPLVAGAVSIVTDGHVACLEFEVYDGIQASRQYALFGRVYLGEDGAIFAKSVLGHQSKNGDQEQELVEISYDPGSSVGRAVDVRGYIDVWGRRQGLWVVKDITGGLPLVELNWENGLPNGPYRYYEAFFGNQLIGSMRMGFEDGKSMEWRSTGSRIVTSWRDGQKHGDELVYGPIGQKVRQTSYAYGAVVGKVQEWLSSGQRVEVASALAPPVAGHASGREAFLGKLREFSTRR